MAVVEASKKELSIVHIKYIIKHRMSRKMMFVLYNTECPLIIALS